MNEDINVVFVTDDNYFKHMFVAIESIIKNTSDNISFFIFSLGINENNIKSLIDRYQNYSNIKFDIISMDTLNLSKYKLKTHVSSAAYAKVFICELLKVDKIIYLDCDLVVNNDIRYLWDEFESDICLKAVWNPFYNYDNEYLGIDDNRKTFNSGVMLLNLDLMRKNNTSLKLKKFLEEYHDRTKLHDQAAFNAVFKDDWKELDLKWNCQVSMLQNHHRRLNISKEKYIELYNRSNIIHYTSNSKPWQFRNSHPYKKLYQNFYKEIFGDVKYKDINIKSGLQFIRETIRYEHVHFKNIK